MVLALAALASVIRLHKECSKKISKGIVVVLVMVVITGSAEACQTVRGKFKMLVCHPSAKTIKVCDTNLVCIN